MNVVDVVLGARVAGMPGPRIASLGYHEVTDHPADSGFQRPLAVRYKHTRHAFGSHLEAIAASRLMPELVTEVDFCKQNDHLLLTFDDGGKSALYVGDTLCRMGWRGHFLITTGLIGSRTFLSRQEIVTLRQGGHVIGSHSHTHPDIFKHQSLQQMQWEWHTSCDILSQLLGEPCVVASVPGGDLSPLVLTSADAMGIRFLFTSEPWLSPRACGGCWILGRASVKTRTPVARVRELADLRGWSRALLGRRCSVLARTAFPAIYRAYVRHQTRSERNCAQPAAHPASDCKQI